MLLALREVFEGNLTLRKHILCSVEAQGGGDPGAAESGLAQIFGFSEVVVR